jgi:Protein of unknown function (DUF2917)
MKPSAYTSGATLNALCLVTAAAKNLSLSLEHQAMVTLPSAGAMTVTCLEGRLWITQYNQPEDIVLEAGESRSIQAGRQTVVYALKLSRISLGATKSPVFTRAAEQRRPLFNWTSRLGFAGIAEWR